MSIHVSVAATLALSFTFSSPTLGALQAPTTQFAPALSWRSGDVEIPRWSAGETAYQIGLLKGQHAVLQFSESLTESTRSTVRAAGVDLLEPIGNGAYYATIRHAAQPWLLATVPSLGYAAPVPPTSKLSEALIGEAPEWARLGDPNTGENRVICIVLLHRDAEQDPAILQLQAAGARVHNRMSVLNAIVLDVPAAALEELTRIDAVQWIEPPLPALRAGNFEAAISVQADLVRKVPGQSFDPAYGLDGTGISVMVYDVGEADTTHQDFGGRVTNRDVSGTDPSSPFHPTHVCGTIGGSGLGDFFAAGMAPNVTINNYGFREDGAFTQGDLHFNPWDLEDDFVDAFTVYGSDIANSSLYAAPTAFFPPLCGYLGAYGATSTLLDQLTLSLPDARIVWITGNDRGVGSCGSSWNTISPPGTAKNVITVGSYDTDSLGQYVGLSIFTGFGPAGDRIKPDVIAPGNQVGAPGIYSTIDNNSYAEFVGTSQAAPVVTGSLALLLQDIKVNVPAYPEPLNSTLKALIVHTAEPESGGAFGGPTYSSGWGRLRIKNAIDKARSESFAEGTVNAFDNTRTFFVNQPFGQTTPISFTLAWDDAPASPAAGKNGLLVHDLDLLVTAPDMNPVPIWHLDPLDPGATATLSTALDQVNNVERATEFAGIPGPWRVEIRSNQNSGSQRFSLVTDGDLILDCNNNGVPDADEIASGAVPDCNNNGFPDSCDIEYGFDSPNGQSNIFLSTDLDLNGVPDECDPDCNNNGIPDGADIASGTSLDCDGNLIPDECQPDCDGDGIPDVCELPPFGTSADCDGDGIPDECQPDCNNNGVNDACDITSGTSLDVDDNGVPDECQSMLNVPGQYATLAAALTAWQPGETILLAAGTYSGSGFEGLSFDDPADFVLVGVAGSGATTIELGQAGNVLRGLTITQCGPGSKIKGITFRGKPPGGGVPTGGVLRVDNSTLLIQNCAFKANRAARGAGLYAFGSQVTVDGCEFKNNHGVAWGSVPIALGGAIYAAGTDLTIRQSSITSNSSEVGGAMFVLLDTLEMADCTVAQNWSTSSTQGGGALAGNYAFLNLERCEFEENDTNHNGGAIWSNGPTGYLTDCLIRGNSSAGSGGGVYLDGSAMVIERCTVRGNSVQPTSAYNAGGGLSGIGTFTVRNSFIVDNSVSGPNGTGGGIHGWYVDVQGSTIAGNTSEMTGGSSGFAGAGMHAQYSLRVRNCIVYGNTGTGIQISGGGQDVDYSTVQDGVLGVSQTGGYGPNNKSAEPKFKNVAGGNYHLKKFSPCIDAGDPAYSPIAGETDVDGQARIQNGRIDMGADERLKLIGQPPPPPPLTDL